MIKCTTLSIHIEGIRQATERQIGRQIAGQTDSGTDR